MNIEEIRGRDRVSVARQASIPANGYFPGFEMSRAENDRHELLAEAARLTADRDEWKRSCGVAVAARDEARAETKDFETKYCERVAEAVRERQGWRAEVDYLRAELASAREVMRAYADTPIVDAPAKMWLREHKEVKCGEK